MAGTNRNGKNGHENGRKKVARELIVNNGLTPLQSLFVEHYLDTFDKKKAVIAAGYQTSYPAEQGTSLLRHPKVAAVIKSRMEERALKDYEVLDRLGAQATGNLVDFLTIDANGKVTGLDTVALQTKGYLIKKLTRDSRGGWSIELYDAQSALTTLGKTLNALTENLRISGFVQSQNVQVHIYIPDNGRGDRIIDAG